MARSLASSSSAGSSDSRALLSTQPWELFTGNLDTPLAYDDFDGRLNLFPLMTRHSLDDGEAKSKPDIKPSREDPYNPFFIPHSILFNNKRTPLLTMTNTNTTAEQPNETPLLNLPTELLTQIFQHVRIPYFQVCLALTCKTMGQIASRPGAMAPWRGYRDKDGLFRLLERKAWIPRSLRLCRACFVFVPRDPEYWGDKISREKAFDKREVNWLDIFNFFDERSSPQHRCPWCNVMGYTSFVSETSYKSLKQKAAVHVAEWEEVCPDVCRRIDQP